ncbi:hypothetical protein [Asaia krungthepensis]|uniref:Fructose-bisphosphate aldolase n=1 Tax=Asaia krungthepensis NRIC 0535 TaxID=1307925 RepID=A0ABQ0PX87_9PROT|nr:hypothetical protein [Asaia krungthepensis]GBQ83822.1 hypothetical protein AA0535_0344 [Asaia krungthepensis NRIC 0535]
MSALVHEIGSRLARKLARMSAGEDGPTDFILADAKDADMAGGLSALGVNRETGRACTLPEFDAAIGEIVRQDLIDILLASVSTLERLQSRNQFDNSAVAQAVRLNDTSDLWRIRGADYEKQPSVPFATAKLAQCPATLGLYSMTFSGDACHDAEALERYRRFREAAQANGVAHFLEVFNPVGSRLDKVDYGPFLNDMVSRALAGMQTSERPVFLKLAYNGASAFEELCRYDPSLVVGIMGGSSGTTRDCLELLHQAQNAGARAALFGRKILDAEHPPGMVEMMRAVTDRRLSPGEAVDHYHMMLESRGIVPRRPYATDSEITEPALLEG